MACFQYLLWCERRVHLSRVLYLFRSWSMCRGPTGAEGVLLVWWEPILPFALCCVSWEEGKWWWLKWSHSAKNNNKRTLQTCPITVFIFILTIIWKLYTLIHNTDKGDNGDVFTSDAISQGLALFWYQDNRLCNCADISYSFWACHFSSKGLKKGSGKKWLICAICTVYCNAVNEYIKLNKNKGTAWAG